MSTFWHTANPEAMARSLICTRDGEEIMVWCFAGLVAEHVVVEMMTEYPLGETGAGAHTQKEIARSLDALKDAAPGIYSAHFSPGIWYAVEKKGALQ